jgi:glycosyltransferase involved in cell wall biosynthesis
MRDPFFSVIIPTFNRADIINRSIYSVLDQDYASFEIIVVDDGSSDNTREVVGKVKDPRVRYFYQKATGGPAAPRNRGIDEAKGDWICFLDSDDMFLPGKLSALASTVAETGPGTIVSILAHNMRVSEAPDGRIIRASLRGNASYREMLINGFDVCNSGSAVRHAFLRQHNIRLNEAQSFVSCEDFDFWLQCAFHGGKFLIIDKVLGIYRREMDSLTMARARHFDNHDNILRHHCFEIQNFTRWRRLAYWRAAAQAHLGWARMCRHKGAYIRMMYHLVSSAIRNPKVGVWIARSRWEAKQRRPA